MHPGRPWGLASLFEIRPYQGQGLRCKVSHPDTICSSCHNAEVGKSKIWPGRIPVCFKEDIHVKFSVREKDQLFFLDAVHSFWN